MKRFLMLVGVAVVAAAMYVAAAPGSQQANAPTARQFNALKKQVATLSKKLKALTKDEAAVKVNATGAAGFIANCFISQNAGVLPINQFGSTTGTGTGYQIGTTGAPSTTSSVTTALDVDGTTTNFSGAYIQGVDPTCVTTGTGAAAHAQTHSGIRGALRAERSR